MHIAATAQPSLLSPHGPGLRALIATFRGLAEMQFPPLEWIYGPFRNHADEYVGNRRGAIAGTDEDVMPSAGQRLADAIEVEKGLDASQRFSLRLERPMDALDDWERRFVKLSGGFRWGDWEQLKRRGETDNAIREAISDLETRFHLTRGVFYESLSYLDAQLARIESATSTPESPLRDSETSASTTLATEPSEHPVFEKGPTAWVVRWRGEVHAVPDLRGLIHLRALVERQNVEQSCYELDGRQRAGDAEGDAVLDSEAMTSIRRRIEDLDGVQTDEAEQERSALVAEWARERDVLGRSRRVGSTDKRVRQAVTKRIDDAIKHAAKSWPDLGEYLRVTILTGQNCKYEPSRWSRERSGQAE